MLESEGTDTPSIQTLLDKVRGKKKLTIDEQIKYLKHKDIKFIKCSEERAKKILSEQTYYYKVTTFRKNFEKDIYGKYIDLDFNVLNDLAIVDMHLRYLSIKLSLDVEHSIKTLLINFLTESDEDGYSIVTELVSYEKEQLKKRLLKKGINEQEISRRIEEYITTDKKIINSNASVRDYNYDLFSKRQDKISIWVLIELMSLGDLFYFIDFYVNNKKYKYKQLNLAKNMLHYSKNIRDSSAHSRPIIFNIVGPNQFLISDDSYINIHMKNYLINKFNLSKVAITKQIRNFKIHDLCSLLILHDNYVTSKITRKERKKEMRTFISRSRLYKEYYLTYSEFEKVIYLFLRIVKKIY